MTQEALKLALEALESSDKLINGSGNHFGLEGAMDGYYSGCFDVGGNNKLLNKAITAIKEALREHAMREVQRLGQEIEQEPVAIKRMKEWIEYLKRKSDFGQHMKIPSEMSAGTCWELAIELEQFINTAPSQRTWVGLTDEDKHEIELRAGITEDDDGYIVSQVFKLTEAKLKEKNT
jgi:hypothetical protein